MSDPNTEPKITMKKFPFILFAFLFFQLAGSFRVSAQQVTPSPALSSSITPVSTEGSPKKTKLIINGTPIPDDQMYRYERNHHLNPKTGAVFGFRRGGNITHRKITHSEFSGFSGWADKMGKVEAHVCFRLTVLPDGHIKEGTLGVEKGSGYPELDKIAYESLSHWEFAPLDKKARMREKTGTITFDIVSNIEKK